MNDKTESKVDTKIEAEELKDEALGDEALENVDGGPHFRNFHGTYTDYSGASLSDDNHDQWIDVLSIDWGSHKPGS